MKHDSPTTRLTQARSRIKYSSARSFYFILAAALVLTFCISVQASWQTIATGQDRLFSRDLDVLESGDDKCRLVHAAKDQCNFIKKHCIDDDAGFSAYLDLYFCQLPHVKPIAFIILAAWLGLLFSTIGIAASDFFCVDLSTMAKLLGMSESMAGVTLLAFGNGSPDVFSTFAAMNSDSGDLAVGELMGAAGFITAVVAGSMALIKPFKVAKKSLVRDVCFFAGASAFTMVILADGVLHLWECLSMIGYYVFYVIFVLFWHWLESRRRKRHDRESAARGHYSTIDENGDELEPYQDDPDDAATLRTPLLRAPSGDDFAALERSTLNEEEADGDYDDDERDRWMSELNTNMRLSRPTNTRLRSATIAPVRPSLVGALEFQAVLKSLQKHRNMRTIPLNNRRHSDDPNLRAFDPVEPTSPEQSPKPHRPTLQVHIPQEGTSSRAAYTAREAPAQTLDTQLQWRGQSHAPIHHEQSSEHRPDPIPPPLIEVSQASPPLRPADAATNEAPESSSRPVHLRSHTSEEHTSHRTVMRNLNSPHSSPKRMPQIYMPSPPRSRSSTRSTSTRTSPFPTFHDDLAMSSSSLPHLALPPPVVPTTPSTEVLEITSDTYALEDRPTHWKYWPYKVLPPPESLACVLFPTIAEWQGKSLWAKALSLVAAPSVFLLTISLPVVESDSETQELESPFMTKSMIGADGNIAKPGALHDGQSPHHRSLQKANDLLVGGTTGLGNSATAAVSQEDNRRRSQSLHADRTEPPPPSSPRDSTPPTATAGDWPRWLLLIQLYVAPLTIVVAVWLQTPEQEPFSWLLKPFLVCLLISTVLLIPILATTTPTYKPPQYRIILSLVGFAVSIAWISTIANEVVGALKALAVILNWSNAIMGLTVFAVGNSVGDLVADVTVANLGYPVMALSACFGGPMLNILLGIGLSGTYAILNGASKRKHKHPDKSYKIKTYHLDVGQTLIVSGVALLVTLVGVLILVPLNKWMMTRKIGIALIILWVLATIGNVVLEVTGFPVQHKSML